MAGDLRYLSFMAMTSMATAGTADEMLACVPEPGEFVLEGACFTPSTAVTGNNTNFATLTVKKGSTAVVTAVTTEVGGSLVKGTPIVFALSATADRTFTGQTDSFEVGKAIGGSGAIIEGVFSLVFRKVRL